MHTIAVIVDAQDPRILARVVEVLVACRRREVDARVYVADRHSAVTRRVVPMRSGTG